MVQVQGSSRLDTVSDVMTRWVITVSPSDSLLKARDVMSQNRTSQLVIVDPHNRPIGSVSKRDIARFLLDDTTTRDLEEITISEASSTPVSTMSPHVAVLVAARTFDENDLVYAIVANDNPLSGIITETDLCHYFSQKWPGKFKVGDFMATDFVFAKSSYPAIHVANGIIFRQSCIPVIDEELVGILTLSDLLSVSERMPTSKTARVHLNDKAELAIITTKELMTPNPITTHEGTDLAQAAQILIKKSVSSLPVVDKESKVVGLITKRDIVKALGKVDKSVILEA